MTRPCPSCGESRAAIVATITAETIVRANPTYRPDAQQILGVAASDGYALARCANCALVYAGEPPDDTFLARVYQQAIDPAKAAAVSKSPSWIAHQLMLAAGLLSRLGNGTVRILDYGCGDGTVVKAMNAAGIRCVGYEPHPRETDPNIVTTGHALSAIAPFDGILLSDVLEHVREPRRVLAECHALLADRGWLCVSVPDFRDARLRAIVADLSAGRAITPELNPWEHLNYFAPATLSDLLTRSGFEVDPEPPRDFGYRAASRGVRKMTNAIRSTMRLLRFAVAPEAGSTTLFARKLGDLYAPTS